MNNHIKKIFISIIGGCIVILSPAIFASAATSQSIDQLTMIEYKQSILGDRLAAPTTTGQAGDEYTNTASGNLQISSTDLYLKGKGGLDVEIKRNYGSLISTEYKDEMYSIGDLNISNRHKSEKLIFKYYINNTSDYVYVYFDNEEQLLDRENANGEIYTSQDYSKNIIPCDTSATVTGDYYESLLGDNSQDIKEKGFIKHYELPSGNSVILKRDKSLECDKVTYTSVNAHEAISCRITPNYITLGEDWYFSLDKMDILSITHENAGKYTYYTESGNLLTRDGEMLRYEAVYRYNSDTEVYEPDGGNVISSEGKSKMYSISIDYGQDSMEYSEEVKLGFRYTTKVTDYQGKKLYFNRKGDLVAEEDRFGNRIIYDKTAREIIDTYGRVINLPKGTNNSIRVNDKEVVKYSIEVENNDKLDPYGLLEVDNKKHLKVNYNMDENQEIVYTTQNHRNLYRFQAKDNMTTAEAYNTDINYSELYPTLEEITLPTGAKIKYEYEKNNVFFEVNRFTYEKYKLKSRQDIEVDGTSANKYIYTYDNPSEGILKSTNGRKSHKTTVVRPSDGYTYIDNYDVLGRLESKEIRAGDEYTLSNFKYVANTLGSYNISQEKIKKYNKNYPSNYIEKTTDYEYNDVQQITKKTIGNYTETHQYTMMNYYLPVSTKIYRGDNKYTLIEYDNDGKSITSVKTSDMQSNKKTQVKNTTYRYNQNGDLIYDSSTGKEYSYDYSDLSYDETNENYPTGNSLTVTDSITARGIVDDDWNTISDKISTVSTYDMFGNIVSTVDAKDNTTTYEYDSQRRLIKITYPDNSTNTTEYFDNLNEIITTDENGNKSKLCYDSLGRYSEGYVFNPNSKAWVLAEKYTYDSNGNVKTLLSNREEDGAQAVRVEYSYYPDGRKKSEVVRNANNSAILSEYTVGGPYYYTNDDVEEGLPAHEITYFIEQYSKNGSDHVDVEACYDLFGNKVEERLYGKVEGITYNTATTKYTYDYVGNMLTKKEPNLVKNNSSLYTIQNVYDALGNVVKTTNIDNKSATNTYNTTTGLLMSSTDFNGNKTTYSYNCFNQVSDTYLPTGGKQTTYYDVNGNVAKVDTLRESDIYDSIRYVYDNRNRNIAVIGNDGEKDVVTQYEYDRAGNQIKLVQGLEEVSDLNNLSGKDYSMNTYTYNYLNQCVSATDAMGQTQTYEYDLFGNVLQSVDRNGDTISYTYTPLGYLTSVSSSKDNTSVSYTYDEFGNRTSMKDATGTTTYKYNLYNQILKETKGNVVKEYTYDLNGNQLTFKITDSGKVTLDETYSYNNLNQVSGITASDITANFTYDNNGNMLTYSRNGISTSYTYNSGNMPTSVVTQRGYSRYEKDTMSYYLNGNKKTTNDANNNTTTYIYDGLGRLSSEQNTDGYSASYSYDNYGNRIEKIVDDGDNLQNVCYTYDKNNRLVSETSDAQGNQDINRYFYDANGNQVYRNREKVTVSTQRDYDIQLKDDDSGKGTVYEYDGLNRLIKADDGTNVSTYTYDGNNLRQSKTVNGVTTQHIYNGMNVVQEKDINGLKAIYHRAGNQIIYSEVDGNNNFYVYNAQGNVTKLLDTSYTMVADYTYDAFGVQRAVNGDVYNPFRHNGEYYDDELGYTYLRNRYYDTSTGRFINEDPIKDGLNWYSYCAGNPVMNIDPLGLSDVPRDLDWDRDGFIDSKRDRERFDSNHNNIADWIEAGYTNANDWYADMKYNILPDFKELRQTAETCAEACVSMVIWNLTGRKISDEYIAKRELFIQQSQGKRLEDTWDNLGLTMKDTLNLIEKSPYLNGSNYKVINHVYDKRSLTPEFIKKQIDSRLPVLITYEEHMQIVKGYDYRNNENNIILADPQWPNIMHIEKISDLLKQPRISMGIFDIIR